MNPGKFQHLITRGRRELKVFHLKGLLFTYLSMTLGYNMMPSPPPTLDELVVPHAAGSSRDEMVDKPSVKQTALGASDIGLNVENMVHRAALMFSDAQVEWNQNKICKLLKPTQAWHSEQAKRLTTIDATIPWETGQILGGIDTHISLCLYQCKWTREYESFGITTVWKACTMSLGGADGEYSSQ